MRYLQRLLHIGLVEILDRVLVLVKAFHRMLVDWEKCLVRAVRVFLEDPRVVPAALPVLLVALAKQFVLKGLGVFHFLLLLQKMLQHIVPLVDILALADLLKVLHLVLENILVEVFLAILLQLRDVGLLGLGQCIGMPLDLRELRDMLNAVLLLLQVIDRNAV